MADIKVLVWDIKTHPETTEPDVEIRIPSTMARWVPRMMAFVPRKAREEMWGADADFNAIFGDIEKMVNEVSSSGIQEIADVKTKEAHIKIIVQRT